MNAFLIAAMYRILKVLIQEEFVDQVKDIVVTLMDKDMPGEEKRKIALQQAKDLGYDIGNTLMNMALEIVVAYVKSR